jgi:hypothetical protein
MAMRDLKSIEESNSHNLGRVQAAERREIVERARRSPEQVRRQQEEHGRRVELRRQQSAA